MDFSNTFKELHCIVYVYYCRTVCIPTVIPMPYSLYPHTHSN